MRQAHAITSFCCKADRGFVMRRIAGFVFFGMKAGISRNQGNKTKTGSDSCPGTHALACIFTVISIKVLT